MGVISNGAGGGGGNIRYDKTTQYIQVKDDQGWFNWRKAMRVVWDAIANAYGQTDTGSGGRLGYTTNGDYATATCSTGSNMSARIFFDTPVPSSGTLHIKGNASLSTTNTHLIFQKNTSKAQSGATDIALVSSSGDFEFTAIVTAGEYLCVGCTYTTVGNVGFTATISEFYVD